MATALDRHDAKGLRDHSPLRFDRVVEGKPAVQSSYATAIVELVQQSSRATGVAELAAKYGKPLWRLTPAVIQTHLRPVVQACLRRLGR